MKYQTTPLFAIPLFYTNIGTVDPTTMAWIERLEYPDEAAGHEHTEDKYILNQPKLAGLKTQIQKACNVFVKEELKVNDDVTFELQNSWINKHSKDESNSLHRHSNAMLSGVYYIQNEPGAGDIVFQKSHLYTNLFHDTVRVSYSEPAQYNTGEFYITPRSGDIVMFPSHLEHQVTPNLTTTPRYSLAFNFFARGTVGGGTSELKI